MAGKSCLDIKPEDQIMNHAVKEYIIGDILFIKVDPQPPGDASLVEFNGLDYLIQELRNKISWFVPANNDLWPCERKDAIPTPLCIGDTVYQGEKWRDIPGIGRHKAILDRDCESNSWDLRSPETMPIELAGKTYKVIEINIMLIGNISVPKMDIESDGQWMWKYILEEIEE